MPTCTAACFILHNSDRHVNDKDFVEDGEVEEEGEDENGVIPENVQQKLRMQARENGVAMNYDARNTCMM